MENLIRRNVCPVFKGDLKNYPFWKKRMEQYLKLNNLQYVLERTPEEEDYSAPTIGVEAVVEQERAAKFAKRLHDDAIVMNDLFMAVDDEVMGQIADCGNAREIIIKLDEIYVPKGPIAMLGLRSKLYLLKNERFSSLKDIFTAHEDIVQQLKNMGENLLHEEQVNTLLIAIPDEFKHILGALSVMRREELLNMSLTQIKRIFTDSNIEMSCEPKGMALLGGNAIKKKKPQNKRYQIKCFSCGMMGHMKKNCLAIKRKQNKNAQTEAQAHVALPATECKVQIPLEKLYVTTLNNIGYLRHVRGDPWNENLKEKIQERYVRAMPMGDMPVQIPGAAPYILDSGATSHMIRERNFFSEMWECPDLTVSTAKNGERLVCKKIGNGSLRNNINEVKLYNVFFIPELSSNLISVTQLVESGYRVDFNNESAFIRNKSGKVLLKAHKINGLYHINVCLNEFETVFMGNESNKDTWHKRFGHIGEDNLIKLYKNDMVIGLDSQITENSICDSCTAGKQSRLKFNKHKESKSSRPLQLIHTDVCGPMSSATHDGFRYFVSFIDDFTHFVVVYLIRNKHEVLSKFIEYEAMVTAHFSLRICSLKSDNGGEYIGRNFENFCKSKGIQMKLTAPYTPEQNGVSERMNRTLMEKVRSIMHAANIPQKLWGEAMYTSMFLTNRSPTSALEHSKTPYEMWYGSKPDISRLKVYGCVSYCHVNKVHRRKLDAKTQIMAMIGYGTNGYRLWNDENNKIVTSRDVIFDENKYFFNKSIVKNNSKYIENNVKWAEMAPNLSNMQATIPETLNRRNSVPEDGHRESQEVIGQDSDNNWRDTSDRDSDEAHSPEFVSVNVKDEHLEEQNTFSDALEFLNEDCHENTRSGRSINRPAYLNDYETSLIASIDTQEVPQNMNELMNRDDWQCWKEAIDEELTAMHENNAWTLIEEVPKGKVAINSMWIFKIKDIENVPRYKARLVAKGCAQRPGMDFQETFAPVAKIATIRTLLSIAVQRNLLIHQMDVKTAFLNGELKEEIYMRLPKDEQGKSRLCKLNRCIYGLKQASRNWNIRFDKTLMSLGFHKLLTDTCVYKSETIIIVLYVDDILIFCDNICNINMIKDSLTKSFKMKDLGEVKQFLGLDIVRNEGLMKISQKSYIEKLLFAYGMQNSKCVDTPMVSTTKWVRDQGSLTKEPYKALLGSLQYLALLSRPDICFAINLLSQFQSDPREAHWNGLKRVLRYLKGTSSLGLTYRRSHHVEPLTGFADADFANGLDDRRSTSGCLFKVYGNTVSWGSKKQPIVVLSSTEAELVALCWTTKEGLWLSNLLQEIGISTEPFCIHEDNIPCINIAEEPRSHQRTKHIDTQYMFIRELIKNQKMKLKYLCSEYQIADLFTKPLGNKRFNELVTMIKMN